jgi:hypothetical protein
MSNIFSVYFEFDFDFKILNQKKKKKSQIIIWRAQSL